MSNTSPAGIGLSTSCLVLRLVSVSSGRGDDLHTEGGPNPRLLPSANKIFSAPSHGLHGAKVTAVTASRAQKVSWPSGGWAVSIRADRRIGLKSKTQMRPLRLGSRL